MNKNEATTQKLCKECAQKKNIKQIFLKPYEPPHMLTISCVDMKIRVNKMRSDDHIKTL